MASLELILADSPGRVRLIAAEPYTGDLRKLSTRYPSARQPTLGTLELELDDLLINLAALASWPDPLGVEWEPALAKLVEDVVNDSQTAAGRLSQDVVASASEVSPNLVSGLLGTAWRGR